MNPSYIYCFFIPAWAQGAQLPALSIPFPARYTPCGRDVHSSASSWFQPWGHRTFLAGVLCAFVKGRLEAKQGANERADSMKQCRPLRRRLHRGRWPAADDGGLGRATGKNQAGRASNCLADRRASLKVRPASPHAGRDVVIEKRAKETLQAQRQQLELGHRHAGCCFNSCPNCQCLHRCPGSTEAGTARGGGRGADLGALKTRRSAGKGHTAEAVKRGGGPCLHETQQGPERCDS